MAKRSSALEDPKEPASVRRYGPLLPRRFYSRSPDLVARNLLGKVLVRPEEELAGRIVEVEAYFGDADPAAHAFTGPTERNKVLFGPPGHAYVYFVYGMHFCLNVSCGPEGSGGGVLFRALEPLAGLAEMARRRWPGNERWSNYEASTNGAPALLSSLTLGLTSGPGRLCQAFGITRARDNGADYTSPDSALQIRDDGFRVRSVRVTPRIGIRKAADRMARYLIEGNKFVSHPA